MQVGKDDAQHLLGMLHPLIRENNLNLARGTGLTGQHSCNPTPPVLLAKHTSNKQKQELAS
jgi:hypothetical protein